MVELIDDVVTPAIVQSKCGQDFPFVLEIDPVKPAGLVIALVDCKRHVAGLSARGIGGKDIERIGRMLLLDVHVKAEAERVLIVKRITGVNLEALAVEAVVFGAGQAVKIRSPSVSGVKRTVL